MPYSVSQLNTFYSNANLGITPSAAESLLIQAYATEDASGSLTDAQTLASVLTLSQDKTDVALLTYQFFTGASPTIAGLGFLVNGTTNPNDLGSAYYSQFNKENRYYNFAVNLATASASAAAFATSYGTLTFAQAVQVAYENIVGSAVVGVAQAAAAEAAITADQSYFASIAAARAPTANQDLATKAIMIGYILEEAQKADVGAYARSVDQFMTALATTGTAATGNLLTLYPPSNVPGVAFALTAGIDNFMGSAGNDTVSSTNATFFSALDNLNGGGGANLFSIVDGSNAITGIPASATLTNFSTLNLESGVSVTFNSVPDAGALLINSISATFTTLTAATSTSINATSTGNVTITGGLNVAIADSTGADTVTGAAGTVTDVNTAVNAGANATGGAVTISGGTADAVTMALGATSVVNFTETFGLVTVNGGAGTTSVVVSETAAKTASATATGIVDGGVVINDAGFVAVNKPGTIASVTLTNTAASAINDNGLTTLTLAGVEAVTTAENLAVATATTLALNLNGTGAATTYNDSSNEVSTINATVTGTNALASITDTGLKTLSLAGTGTLALNTWGLAADTALNIGGAVGLSGTGVPLDVSGGAASLTITDSSSATVNVKISSTQTFAGAASTGRDIVTITADATKPIVAGSAPNNEIILSGAGSVFTTTGVGGSKTPGNLTGFTVLGTDGGSSGIFNLTALPTITSIDVTGAAAGGVQFINVINQTPISIDTTIAGGVTYQTVDATGSADSVVATIGTATSAGIATGGQLTFQDSTLLGLGTVTLNSISAVATLPATNTVTTLNDTNLSSLTFTGNAITAVGMLIDNGSSLSVTNSSAAGLTDTITGFTAANLKTVTLSGNIASPALNLASAAGVTISGASDNAAITSVLAGGGTATTVDTVTLGTGHDSVTDNGIGIINITLGGAAAGDTVVVHNAAIANIVIAGGANSVTANSAGSNNVTLGATGTAAETVILGTGTNTVVLGAHTGVDNVSVAAHGTAPLSAIITGLNSTATGADTITFLGDAAAAGPVTFFSVTQINAYANLHGLDSTQLATSLAAMFDTAAAGHLGAGLAADTVGAFDFQGNTYIVEQAGALGAPIGAGDTVVELTGIVPVTALSIATAGVLALHG